MTRLDAAFTIRVAGPADEAGVEALLAASYPVLMAPGYDAASLAAFLPVITRANPALLASGTFYLAETGDGAVIGCGGWSTGRPGSGKLEAGLAHIRHFATHHGWARCGIGRALYETCEAAARAAGVRRFECYASLNAVAFYEALGFVPVREIKLPMPRGVTAPAMLMERRV